MLALVWEIKIVKVSSIFHAPKSEKVSTKLDKTQMEIRVSLFKLQILIFTVPKTPVDACTSLEPAIF